MPTTNAHRRLGGLATSMRYDPMEYTAAARKAAEDRFYNATDPSLPEAERRRRADAARRFFMSQIAQKRWRKGEVHAKGE